MAEGARLESVYTGNRIGGSNPPLSAINTSRYDDVVKWLGSIKYLAHEQQKFSNNDADAQKQQKQSYSQSTK